MARVGIGMRWWLALAFALIAALTAVAVGLVFSKQSESAFRERAQELAVGSTVAAAEGVTRALRRGDLERAVDVISERRRLALFIFDGQGELLTEPRSHRTDLANVPGWEDALRVALAGDRYVTSFDGGRSIVVSLPLGSRAADAMVAYASRPELAAEVGIVRDKIVEAALWAILVGAVAGLLVATLIAMRLRRIAASAAQIEAGNFEMELRPRFHDELGSLATTIDRMRQRLKESFSRLESERDQLEQLLGRLHDGVVTVDRTLTVEFANNAAAELLGGGTAPGDPLPDPWEAVSLRELAAGLFREDFPVAQARVAPGEDRTIAVVGIPARHPSESAVLVLTDISERERHERAEREFVANAAHELRTPLAAITSSIEVLQSGAKEVPEERDRFLAHLERESARLGRLARALLVLARAETQAEAPRLGPVELRPVLETISAGIRPHDGVVVEILCAAGLAALSDRDVVEQVVENLAANAAKHTVHGRIELAAVLLAGESVAIEVRDTGPGIPAEERERVFDRFYRSRDRDSDGFGLGLAIARQAVRALGGSIRIDSKPGAGTTVRVTLPAASREAA